MVSRTLSQLGLLSLTVLTLSCVKPPPGDSGTTGGTTDGGATVDSGTTDAGTTDAGTTDGGTTDGGTVDLSISGKINGTVRVQLYTDGTDGERTYIAWEDTQFGDDFPFGAIFVTSTQDDGDGGLYYRGDDTILEPSIAGDPYSLSVTLPTGGPVRVYATLDLYADGILSTFEPIGIYPLELELTDGDALDDKDITILVDYDSAYSWWLSSGGGGSGGNGGGGGGGGGTSGCDNPVAMSGIAMTSSPWKSGDFAVMLYDTNNEGPYYYDRSLPTATDSGAQMDFSISTCGPLGVMNVLGAWDSNGNTLIDPADTWGEYVTEPDVSGNPLDIDTADTSDMLVQIPLGDGRPNLGIVPFVSLQGHVTFGGTSFDKLPTDSVVYLTALLYRPEGDIAIATLSDEAYDSATWTSVDYAGTSSLPFTLWVPGDTVVYLWAYVDEGPKPDGLVNTAGEIVGSGGGDITGRMDIGTSSIPDLTVDLGYGR